MAFWPEDDDPDVSMWFDKNDPAFHDCEGNRGVQTIIARFNKWLAQQEPERQALFCEHASYVGFGGALRYRCVLCNPNGDL